MAGPLTPALISAGSSLLGGLFGRKKGPSIAEQRENLRQTELQRFSWLRDGARKAGFNPLTVLRATGGQMAPAITQQTPLSSRAILGEAIKTFGGTYAADAIERAAEERAQDQWKDRYDYEIANRPPLPPVRTAPVKPQVGKIKIGGDRVSDYLVEFGPLAGRLVIPVGDGYRLAPQGWVPAGLTEELFGSITAEADGVGSLANMLTWPKISVAKDGTVRLPKSFDKKGNPTPLKIDITQSPKYGQP